MSMKKNKRLGIPSALLFAVIVFSAVYCMIRKEERVYAEEDFTKRVSIVIDGAASEYGDGSWGTVGDLLADAGADVEEGDEVFPAPDTSLSSGMRVTVSRRKTVTVAHDGTERELSTVARTVGDAIAEAGIPLGEDDLVAPSATDRLDRKTAVKIIRVETREETVDKGIPFKTEIREDPSLGWRVRTVERKGTDGVRTYRYRVSYHDGREVARKLLDSEVTKDPVTEDIVQGTLVKTGKSHAGGASWYDHTGTMSAANPWLPIGSYVRVTNRANGKSVIVRINDRGPFVGGRIIDLDRVAFREIASIGAGVIDVKMEEIVN